MAQCYFEEISDKLEKLQTIALLLLIHMREVDQDIISINAMELLEGMAGDAGAVYKLEDFFKKYRSCGEQEHEREASHV